MLFSCISVLCLRDKLEYDKIPHTENYIDFNITGKTLGKKWQYVRYISSGKLIILPRVASGKKTPNKTETNAKSASESEKGLHLYNNQICVIWKMKGASLAKAAEEVRESFNYEREALTEKEFF